MERFGHALPTGRESEGDCSSPGRVLHHSNAHLQAAIDGVAVVHSDGILGVRSRRRVGKKPHITCWKNC